MSNPPFAYTDAQEKAELRNLVQLLKGANIRALRFKMIQNGAKYEVRWKMVNEANEKVAGAPILENARMDMAHMESTLVSICRHRQGLWVLDPVHGCLIFQGTVNWKDKDKEKIVRKTYPASRWTTWDFEGLDLDFHRIQFEEEESPVPNTD